MAVTDHTRHVVARHLARPHKTAWAARVEAEHRVPVDSLWPGVYWLACIAGPDEPENQAVLPTDAEVAQVASYIDYLLVTRYREGYAAQLRALPLACDGAWNTVVLVKRASGWGYRRSTWRTGSWPHAYQHRPEAPTGLSLLQVLDHIEGVTNTVSAQWLAWQAAHSDVFPAGSPVVG
jgi:hypothetical protein